MRFKDVEKTQEEYHFNEEILNLGYDFKFLEKI